MNDALAAELAAFREAFSRELSAVLAELRADPEVFGFGIDLPEDFSNLGGFCAFVGREDVTGAATPGTVAWATRRYVPVEWGDGMKGAPWSDTGDRLEAIQETLEEVLPGESDEETPEEVELRDALYDTFLGVMAEKADAGEFGGVGYRVLLFNDDDHPITRRSLDRLNDPATAAAAADALGL